MTEHNDAAERDRGRHITEHDTPSRLPDAEGALEAAYGRRAFKVGVCTWCGEPFSGPGADYCSHLAHTLPPTHTLTP